MDELANIKFSENNTIKSTELVEIIKKDIVEGNYEKYYFNFLLIPKYKMCTK